MRNFKWLNLFRGKQPDLAPATASEAAEGFNLLFGSRDLTQPKHLAAHDTVVIVGNCLAETMAAGLASVPAAARKRNFIAVPLHLKSIDDPDARQALRRASHVFLQGVVATHIETIRSVSSSECQIILYPDVVLRSPWPFDHMSGFRDVAVDAAPNAVIRQHDGALAKLREAIPDKKKRFQAYRDLEFDGASAIDRIIETQRRFLQDIDIGTDAFLGRFIMRHFKERQLFYDSVHPSAIVFQELCEFAWRKLAIPGQPPAIKGMDGWKDWAVPVHPLIARRLGLTWASERTRYKYGSLGSVTWDEWVHVYIDTFG